MEKLVQRTTKNSISMDLTPMIDVVFLLLIFFMLSSTLVKENNLKVNLPEADGGKNTQAVNEDYIITISNKGEIYFNNKKMSIRSLGKKFSSAGKDSNVVIKGDKKVYYDQVIKVMALAKQKGLKKVSLAIKSN